MSNKLRAKQSIGAMQSRSSDRVYNLAVTPQPTSLVSTHQDIQPHVFSMTSPAYRMPTDSSPSSAVSSSSLSSIATAKPPPSTADATMNDAGSPSPRTKRHAASVYEDGLDIGLPVVSTPPLSKGGSAHQSALNSPEHDSTGRTFQFHIPAPRPSFTKAVVSSSSSSSASSSLTSTPVDTFDSGSDSTSAATTSTIEHGVRGMLLHSTDGPLRSHSISPLQTADCSVTRLMHANNYKVSSRIFDGSNTPQTMASITYENARCDSMIIGLTPLKQWVKLNILFPLFCTNREIQQQMRRSPPQRGQLFISEYGSGVSSYFAAMCKEFNINLIVIRAEAFDVTRLQALFNEALNNQPCVVLFDHTYSWFSPGAWTKGAQLYFAAVRDLADGTKLVNIEQSITETVSSGSPFMYQENVWSVVSLAGPLEEFPVDDCAMGFMNMHITYLDKFTDMELQSFMLMYYKKLWGDGADIDQNLQQIRTQALAAAQEFKGQMPGFITHVIRQCMTRNMVLLISKFNSSDIALSDGLTKLPLLSDIKEVIRPMRERAALTRSRK